MESGSWTLKNSRSWLHPDGGKELKEGKLDSNQRRDSWSVLSEGLERGRPVRDREEDRQSKCGILSKHE